MHDTRTIAVMEDIHGENDRLAEQVNHTLTHKRVFVVNEMGAPGIGKTTALIHLIDRITRFSPCVIEGDIESDLDTQTLTGLGVPARQVNTFGACHLDAPLVADAVLGFDFGAVRGGRDGVILFIENVGNLVCPAEFSIGEHIKMLVCSVTEGSDKPYKYPLAFEKADLVLLNKVDLAPYLDFDEAFFMKGLRALNPGAPVIRCSSKTGEGFGEAASVLESMAATAFLDGGLAGDPA
ncbi:MAG: hydrogenase nickel incorporation protein HypB [Clostridiales Family XIII bacterium]|jgi:hydrogenase nickel incorporation protein HypB|nr:hydrogenase nickel incorporation protein HypB [Clostridiales Family XIII bacterium]